MLEAKIRRLRKEGHSYSEIANKIGRSRKFAWAKANKVGFSKK